MRDYSIAQFTNSPIDRLKRNMEGKYKISV